MDADGEGVSAAGVADEIVEGVVRVPGVMGFSKEGGGAMAGADELLSFPFCMA